MLAASIALLVGLLGMLLLRRERIFARAEPAPDGGGTVLATALLTRGSGDSASRFADLDDDLRTALAERTATRSPAPEPESTSRET